MNVKERLIVFIKSLNKGQGAFEKEVGLSNGYINNISKGIGAAKLQLILCKYPMLNPNWLMLGVGEMLQNETKKTLHQSVIGNNNVQSGNNSNTFRNYENSIEQLKIQLIEKNRLLTEKDARIKEKDAQIKEKDAQINKLLSILSK